MVSTKPLDIPILIPFKQSDKTGNQVGFIPLYIPANISTGKGHEQSIYSKTPLPCSLGKSKSTSTQDQCRVHPKGTVLYRIQLRHIHIRNRQSADRSINDR